MLRGQLAHVGLFVILWRLDRPPRRRPDRKRELLEPPVAISDLPRDDALLGLAQHAHLVAERREVRITADVDRVLRTRLHARVALPAEIRLDVVRPAID